MYRGLGLDEAVAQLLPHRLAHRGAQPLGVAVEVGLPVGVLRAQPVGVAAQAVQYADHLGDTITVRRREVAQAGQFHREPGQLVREQCDGGAGSGGPQVLGTAAQQIDWFRREIPHPGEPVPAGVPVGHVDVTDPREVLRQRQIGRNRFGLRGWPVHPRRSRSPWWPSAGATSHTVTE
ncbi:hypothetical protein GCM10023223_45500 [Stackebrandtia albiflava]